MTVDEFLRPSDVEAEFGISVDTLSTWRLRTRRGTPVGPQSQHLGPRRIVYRRSVVEAWIAEQSQSSAVSA